MKRLFFLASLALLASAARAGSERKMILHLANGQTIRVVARATDGGGFEYKAQGGWKALEASMVERAEPESEVLARWKTKKSEADKAAASERTDARVAAARWAIDHALLAEGLEVLDVVLRAEPDHAGALETIGARPLLSVPALAAGTDTSRAIDPIFRWASDLPPAARESAVRRIGELERGASLQAALAKELVSQHPGRRSFAALALRRLYPGAELKPLLVRAVLDPSEDVRRAASYALRGADSPGVIAPIVRVLEQSTSATSRIQAAEALAYIGYPEAVEPLMTRLAAAAAPPAAAAGGGTRAPHSHIFVGNQIAYIQDFDVEIAQNSSIGDPVVNTALEGSVLDVAVLGAQQISVTVEQATIRKSLGRLTGAAPGNTSRDWIRWWRENQSRYRDGGPAPATGMR